jgi:hypothetical protein
MRKVFLRLSLFALIVVAATATAPAQSSSDQPKNEIEIRGDVAVPSGEANFSGTSAAGSTLNFSRDFDFKTKLGFDVRFIHRSINDKHKILVRYSRGDWDQTARLTRSFTFLGQTYVANAQLSLDITVRTFRATYAYRWGKKKVRFGPMFDLGFVSTRAQVSGTTNNGSRTANSSISKLAATVGYDLEYNPSPKVNIFNNLGGIVFQGEHLFDTDAGVKYFASRHFGIMGGYKYQWYKVTEDSNFMLVNAHGPFFGGVFRF